MKLKHYLIASPENNYRPWIVTKTAMACFVLSIWALRLLLPGYIAVGAPGLDPADLMSRINNERTNRHLPALITNAKLTSAANIKSKDMIERSYFAHVNPDGDYVWPVIEAQGYKPYQSLGENLALDFFSAEAVVNAWMNSPGHRANILNEKYEDQGMAAVYGEYKPNHNTYLITNLFGTLLKKVASMNTTQATPSPTPTQTQPYTKPVASSQPADPIPTPSHSPAPTPAPSPTPQPLPGLPPTDNVTERAGLVSLKILVAIFAGAYTLFLFIDSIIIYRAKIRRENIPASPHSLMLLMISLTNFLTLWL